MKNCGLIYPSRGRRWANAMSIYSSRVPLEPLISGYKWKSLRSATIVAGGVHGLVSIGLAKAFPNLNFVVQNFADVVVESLEDLFVGLSERNNLIHDIRYDESSSG